MYPRLSSNLLLAEDDLELVTLQPLLPESWITWVWSLLSTVLEKGLRVSAHWAGILPLKTHPHLKMIVFIQTKCPQLL